MTCRVGCGTSVAPETTAVWIDPLFVISNFAAGPAVAVAVNVRLCSPADDATIDCDPAVVPSVQLDSVAMPNTFVVTVPPDGVTDPLPPAGVNVTDKPGIGLFC